MQKIHNVADSTTQSGTGPALQYNINPNNFHLLFPVQFDVCLPCFLHCVRIW